MPRTPEQRKQLRQACDLIVSDFAERSPAEEFREMAAWCELNGVAHDHYGDGPLVAGFEAKVAGLLGQEAAVFMPSGIMAQSAALKVWVEKAGLSRFGMHPTAHLALHEEEAYAALLQCHGVVLGDRLRPLTAGDLDASPQPMACVMVELPIREAGGQLPTWDELERLKAAARQRGLPLHMDGARLWECAAYYGRPCAEIAAGFDSVYVSVYKGIGALSGAVLAGSTDFIAQARLWRRRFGGTLYHLSPLVISAAMRFDARLALMPALGAHRSASPPTPRFASTRRRRRPACCTSSSRHRPRSSPTRATASRKKSAAGSSAACGRPRCPAGARPRSASATGCCRPTAPGCGACSRGSTRGCVPAEAGRRRPGAAG
jgi:threonine aldolase